LGFSVKLNVLTKRTEAKFAPRRPLRSRHPGPPPDRVRGRLCKQGREPIVAMIQMPASLECNEHSTSDPYARLHMDFCNFMGVPSGLIVIQVERSRT